MNTETVSYEDFDFKVDFDYQPEEKEVRYYSDGSGYPGCPASIEINMVSYKGIDITDLFDHIVGLNKIEELLWEKFEDYANNKDY